MEFMKPRILSLLLWFCAFVMPLAYAESREDLQNEGIFNQQELDQMLAPIALYPDALLSQILMAATYPAEVVEAARWSREHPDLRGEAAVEAVEQADWDPSVISLTAFPQILKQMDEQLDWTEQLGDAFLAQQEQVMETVQHLRRQALAAGNLESNDQIRVLQQDQIIIIEHSSPQIVYVPYYNPHVVYGPWWWDAYPPVYWDPWPGYYSGFGPGYYWGSGIHVGLGFFYSNFDWHRHHINVHHHHHRYARHDHTREHSAGSNTAHNKPQRWRHGHRHDVLRPDNSPPLATGQAVIGPDTRQRSITSPNLLQNPLNSYNRNRNAAGSTPNAPTRRPTFNPTLTPDRGNTIPERVEAFRRRDNRLVRPDILPQTRALAPTNQSPITLPRQTISQPQPIRRQEPPSALGSRAFDRQQQAIPNNRAVQLPQRSIAGHAIPSAQPQNIGPSQPQIGGNPLKGNQGQSGGRGQFRH